jgi:hypothetical protein
MASRALAVTTLLAACGATSGSSSSPHHPLECGPVIAGVLARSQAFASQIFAGRQPDPSQQVAQLIEKIEPVVIQSCRDDRWSLELLSCMDGFAVTDDPHKCNHLFTNDQAVALARRMVAVIW